MSRHRETLHVDFGVLDPGEDVTMSVCSCNGVEELGYVIGVTDRDDFQYDKCPKCGKMIRGSARPVDYYDGFDW